MLSIMLAAEAAAQIDFNAIFAMVAGFVMWLIGQVQKHPDKAFEMVTVTLPALAIAIKSHQWHMALKLAGDLSFQAASIAELDKSDKKAWVKARLKQALPAVVRPFFSDKTLDAAVEYGWHVIAKRNVIPLAPPSQPNDDYGPQFDAETVDKVE